MNLVEAQALLPDFRLQRALDPGAQGSVFLAEAQNGQSVVVKVIEGSWTERGKREIEALGLVAHPSVVQLVANGTIRVNNQEQVYLAMGYVEGEDLARRLRAGPISCKDVARILVSIADGLDAIWSQRIVHRDIKPANLMVTPDGRAVLLDLGVALCRALTTLTVYGVPGTPGYMSPEQCIGDRMLTVKSDVFALGISAYEALVGAHPFHGSQEAIARGHRALPIPATVGCSANMVRLIDSMLTHSAAFRPMPHEIVSALAQEVT